MSNTEDYIRKHPFAGTAIALGLGILLQAAAKTAAKTAAPPRERGGKTSKPADEGPEAPRRLVAPDRKTTHRANDTGAADMAFNANYPDGGKIEFRFSFKKRPVDAPESDWPVDHTGFTVDRPSGKNVSFRFARKTRSLPAKAREPGDNDTHSGLGRAQMEFTSSRPNRGDFRFTWTKLPPGEAPGASARKRKSTGR